MKFDDMDGPNFRALMSPELMIPEICQKGIVKHHNQKVSFLFSSTLIPEISVLG